jgi:hypothetical protein
MEFIRELYSLCKADSNSYSYFELLKRCLITVTKMAMA